MTTTRNAKYSTNNGQFILVIAQVGSAINITAFANPHIIATNLLEFTKLTKRL